MSRRSRKGEPANITPRRPSRCFEINDRWYVTTRGARYVGPFLTKEAAGDAAKQLTELLADLDEPNTAEAFVSEFSRRAMPRNDG